ncbi:MAG: hypothetical protein APF77_24145 [Clostridia bacterium BRH_c25]|nr:MAG: hypothetical protein APF77_24145 [Clostridia bacterium BRH_c25]
MKDNILGNRIAHLRRNNSLTQIEFSKILNISNTTLSQYESGKRIPSDNIKLQIADYFNVSLDYLFGRTNIKNTADSIITISSAPARIDGCEDDNIPPQIAEEVKKFKDYLMHKYNKAKDK